MNFRNCGGSFDTITGFRAGRPGLETGRDIESIPSLRHHVHIGSEAHPASYSMDTGDSKPEDKVAEA
jgi:hypothetical protein